MKTTDELKELATLAGDETRAAPERVAAFHECDAGRKERSLGWSKLGLTPEDAQALKATIATLGGGDTVTDTSGATGSTGGKGEPTGDTFEATDDELGGQATRPTVEDAKSKAEGEAIEKAAKRVKRAKAEGAGEVRGGLTRLVESLLMDPALAYLDIINAVLKEFPKANTSARSIASVAAAMRRDGKAVPMRRPVAAAKPAKEVAKAA